MQSHRGLFSCAGCRRWFNALRDTVSHEILGTYRVGARPPDSFA